MGAPWWSSSTSRFDRCWSNKPVPFNKLVCGSPSLDLVSPSRCHGGSRRATDLAGESRGRTSEALMRRTSMEGGAFQQRHELAVVTHGLRWLSVLSCGLHQESSAASHRSVLTAASSSSPYTMAEGQPLLPLTSGTVSPGRSLKVIINLLAVVPLWRPLRLDAARSRLLVPSGIVPGDIVVGCVEFKCWSAGDGAGPDCVPLFLSKVRCANSKGWVVILQFLAALSVICTSGVDF